MSRYLEYLFWSIGVIVAVAGLCDIYEPPISYPLAILTLFGLIFSLCYNFHYWRKAETGLSAVSKDRSELIKQYGDILIRSENFFQAIGISLHSLTGDPNFEQNLITALTKNQQLRVTLVFSEANSNFVRHREITEGRPLGRISSDCANNYAKVLSIKQRMGQLGDRVEVKMKDGYPCGFIIRSDNLIYFSPYFEQRVGRYSPTFKLEKKGGQNALFDSYMAHISFCIS